jgi:hypothetical protein
MIHHYASIPDVFELTTTPLSRSSKGSPTVIEFAKAGAGHHFCPPSTPASNLGDTCRDRYESAKGPILSGGSAPIDMVTRTLVEIARMRTPSNEDMPRPTMDTSLFRHGREGSHWIRLGEFSYLQYLMSLRNNSWQKQLQHRERVSSPSSPTPQALTAPPTSAVVAHTLILFSQKRSLSVDERSCPRASQYGWPSLGLV